MKTNVFKTIFFTIVILLTILAIYIIYKDNKNERIPTNSKKTDVKINLQNGVELYLQDEIKDYCFYKTDDVKCTIKMPEGLVDFVNDVLKD